MPNRDLRLGGLLVGCFVFQACVDRAVIEEYDAEPVCRRFCERASGTCGTERTYWDSLSECIDLCAYEQDWSGMCLDIQTNYYECIHDLSCKDFRKQLDGLLTHCNAEFDAGYACLSPARNET